MTFDGFVLGGAKSSPANPAGALSDTNVPRFVGSVPSGYPTGQPQRIEVAADRYRVLTSFGETCEYLLWAANSGSLSTIEDSSWAITGTTSIPNRGMVVLDSTSNTGTRNDGSNVASILGDDTIGEVISVTFRRGGTTTDVPLTIGVDIVADPAGRKLTLQNTLTVRSAVSVPVGSPVAMSSARGDTLTLRYYIQGSRFWWTRNDSRQRFAWNGSSQRWEPLKGSSPVNLGKLEARPYVLSPAPKETVGSYLKGTVGGSASIRLGDEPDESSYPVVFRESGPFSGILVVAGNEATNDFNFNTTTPPLAGIVGEGSGELIWNPAFVSTYAGLNLWYSPSNFIGTTGEVGDYKPGDLFLAPVPNYEEYPLLKIGQRDYLRAILVANETALSALSVPSGSVGVARTTGKLKFNTADISRSNPGTHDTPNPTFDPLYLGSKVIYEGVSLNRYPQPMKSPVALVGDGGTPVVYEDGVNLYIPDALLLPGTGVSGIVSVPDGTGRVPDATIPVSSRPNGSGLIRKLTAGLGDTTIFGKNGRFTRLVGVEFEEDLPSNPYNIPEGTVYVSLAKHGSLGSKVSFGSDVAEVLKGNLVYFTQSDLTPATYPSDIEVVSRKEGPYTLDGTENLNFILGGTTVNWSAASIGPGTHTAAAVALAINLTIGSAPGSCEVIENRLVLRGITHVAVGFDTGGTPNLSGCESLGFIPGSYAVSEGNHNATDPNWNPDGGPTFGLHCLKETPDTRNTASFMDESLGAIQPSPYVFVTQVPREDLPGYDFGVYFRLSSGTYVRPFENATYLFPTKRFGWMSRTSFGGNVTEPIGAINLRNAGLVPNTLYEAVGGHLKVALEGGSYTYLNQDEDYILSDGSALLINRVGKVILTGGRGRYGVGPTFTDETVTFVGQAEIGDLLALGETYRTVTGVGSHTLTVNPPFVESDDGEYLSWTLHEGVAPGEVDPSILADVTYREFNPLSSDPFSIEVLRFLGLVGGTLQDVGSIQPNSALRIKIDSPTPFWATLYRLEQTLLGTIANDALSVPPGNRLDSGSFSIRVGRKTFSHGTDLIPVASFSPDPGNNVEYIEAGPGIGGLKFGSSVLAEYSGSEVFYVEGLLPSALISSGIAEIDPTTGRVSLSQSDLTSRTGRKIYLAERVVPGENGTINPILGSFTFLQPVPASRLIEVSYTRAKKSSGERITENGQPIVVTELLPSFIRREVATRVSDQVYSFNPLGREIDTSVSPRVYAGPRMTSYGVPSASSVNFEDSTISFQDPVQDGTVVTISYAVLETVGGETTYTVSQPPVWRPPFAIGKGQTVLTFPGDRRDFLSPGKMIRLGGFTTYLKTVTFGGSTTTATIFPAPPNGAGSLAPGESQLCAVTDRPITPSVDGVSIPGVDTGFLATFPVAYGVLSVPRFDPLLVGSTAIVLNGDFTHYAVAGHVLEAFGVPYVISGSDLAQDGRTTTITLTSPVTKAGTWASGMPAATLRISTRPVYPEGANILLGSGSIVRTEPEIVVRFKGSLPGETLQEGRDYSLDSESGNISLTDGIEAGQSIRLLRTDSRTLKPMVFDGGTLYPRVSASFGSLSVPEAYSGQNLLGTYRYNAPDSFYARVLPLIDYVGEVAPSIVSGNPVTPSGNDRGIQSIGSERVTLQNRDRVARTFLSFYNGVCTSFEQLIETIEGNPIGDSDGKFRFKVGHGSRWVPPGYEDPISGVLNPRNLWFEVWAGLRAGESPIRLIAEDPIINPIGATVDGNGRPIGSFQDPASFASVQNLQVSRIQNDVDDVVLVSRERISRSLTGFITYRVKGYGSYVPLSQPSPFSRIFPQRTGVFTTLGPGIGAEGSDYGVYSAGKLTLNLFAPTPSVDYQSTNGQPIGKLENPTLGVIENVMGLSLKDRLARARVWAYNPVGYPSIDAGTTNRPTVLLSQVPFDQFPLVGNLPDTSRLASQSGGLVPTGVVDITTGDPDLHIPPFRPGDALAVGLPDGSIRALAYTGTVLTVGGATRYGGVYVNDVYKGTAITFKGKTIGGADVPITDPSTLVVMTSDTTGTPYDPTRGDTLFVVPNSGSSPTVSDPPTASELATLLTGLPGYRIGTDVGYSPKTGDILDITLPSFSDPTLFGLKEITGQRPPSPMGTIEGVVAFQNGNVEPTEIPALRGESKKDDGDYRLPYTFLSPSETETLGAISGPGDDLLYDDSTSPPPAAPSSVDTYIVEALYPDEIGDNEGVIDPADAAYPCALLTNVDLQPSVVVYPSPGHGGIGTVRPYDVVLVQAEAGTPPGSSGILTVGSVHHGSTSAIEPPRFVAPTLSSPSLDLSVENLQTWIGGGVNGVVVTQDTTTVGIVITTFDFESTPPLNFILDNGSGGGSLPTPVGGYNDFLSQCNVGTNVSIRLVRGDGHFQEDTTVVLTNSGTGANILASSFTVSGDNGSTQQPVNAGGLRFHPQVIEVRTALPFFDFTPFNPVSPSPGIMRTGGYHEASLSVLGVGSRTCSIAADRLTVTLPIDVKTAQPRGAITSGSDSIECSLTITSNTASFLDPTGPTYVTGNVDVNSNAKINGGVPFTFKARSSVIPSVYGVGRFFGGIGSLKVMAWEGYGNIPIEAENVTFKAMPTARQNATTPIFNGEVICDEAFDPPSVSPRLNRFTPSTVLAGNEANVLPGDLLVIRARTDGTSLTPSASGKSGTYLVRDVIKATHGLDEKRVTLTANTGDSNWLGLVFPTVETITTGGSINLTISVNQEVPFVKTFSGTPLSYTRAFRPSGRVFLIVRPDLLSSSDSSLYATSVYSAAYASLSGTGDRTLVNLTDFRDGLGNVVSSGTFTSLALPGVTVSGMTLAPVNPHAVGLPANYPGHTDPSAAPGSRSFFGFRTVVGTNGSSTITLTATTNGNLENTATMLSVYTKVKVASTSIVSEDDPVYDQIPGVVDFNGFKWDDIHTVGAFVPAGTRCFLPGDKWTLNYSGSAGIYVEPSFPRTGNNLGSVNVNVVDSTHSLLANEVGAPSISTYLDSSIVPPLGSLLEIAQAEVRRPRRWGRINTDVTSPFGDLRYVYEIRRGIVASVSTVAGVCTLTAEPVDNHQIPSPIGGGKATQLGDFTNSKVNIHPGDTVRFIDQHGTTSDIVGVQDRELTLVACEVPITPGTRFEVLLRTAPIPHEQSVRELESLATDQVILSRQCNYTTQQGGIVPYTTNPDPQVAYDQSANKLTDTDATISYSGVENGDLVVIDPAGPLSGATGVASIPERGKGPNGDMGVVSRGSDYAPGSPRKCDDNRGFYRVASVVGRTITVTAEGNDLAGDRTNADVVFGPLGAEYSVYPTVHGSRLSGSGDGREGQMDLRPTAFADISNSYSGTWLSVAPFSYRIIRPSSRLSQEAINLIFATRERVLSWLDLVGDISNVNHGGGYRVFQTEGHISKLGLLPDFDTGWGVMSNGMIISIFGRTMVTPFSNNSACLSILDRRFWIGDRRLDTEHPPYGSTDPYADFAGGVGRPVLPDRIEMVLNQGDKLRSVRGAWLSMRTNRIQGTLEALRRFEASLESRIQQTQQKALAARSL